MRLVDRLRGANVLQLRRSVGCRGDQRDARLVGLDDRGMQLGCRRAARRDHDRGPSGREADPQPDESAAPLVVVDVDPDAAVANEGERDEASTASRDRRRHR